MKKIVILGFSILFILSGCKTETRKQKDTVILQNKNFVLKGHLNSYLSKKVFLNKIIEQTICPIDSSFIENNEFVFYGSVEYPERFALSFENYSATIILILENTNFNIEIDANQLNEAAVTGSELNSLLNEYKQASKEIFKKIEYLYPHFQKARLENDVEKLKKIGLDMKNIEDVFTNFSYGFIKENANSYVAAMILRDQLKTSTVDTARITQMYHLLSNKVKNAPDAQIISTTLNLH